MLIMHSVKSNLSVEVTMGEGWWSGGRDLG